MSMTCPSSMADLKGFNAPELGIVLEDFAAQLGGTALSHRIPNIPCYSLFFRVCPSRRSRIQQTGRWCPPSVPFCFSPMTMPAVR
jgi:hypothetical protein